MLSAIQESGNPRYRPSLRGVGWVCLIAISMPAIAYEADTHYTYDSLSRLTQVDYLVEANGQPARTLYTTTYTYDKNGNRIGMVRSVSAPEIDSISEASLEGGILTLEVPGFGYQQGVEFTLELCDGRVVTGTVVELTPVRAVVAFDLTVWPVCTEPIPVLNVDNPDGQSTTGTYAPTVYALTVNVFGNGTVDASPSPPYYTNTPVSLTATAQGGSTFAGWSGHLSGTANPETLVMDADKTVNATFTAPGEVALLVTVVGGGRVSLSPEPPYAVNTNVTMTAVADNGWRFDNWSGAVTGATSPAPVLMDTTKQVTATFSKFLVITRHPIGGIAVEGEDHTFTIEVAGATGTVDYQWKKREPQSAVLQNIPLSPNGPTFLLEDLTLEDTGYYACEVSDDLYTVLSAESHLEVAASLGSASALALLALAGLLAMTGAMLVKKRTA